MRVCVVAQVENWRGGIQQYSANYTTSLSRLAETSVIGYKSFFPIWLYPGSKDGLKAASAPCSSVRVYNVLKYYSLLSSIKAASLIKNLVKPNVVDIQWCTTFHAPILIPLILLIKRMTNASVFLTVHNVVPHEGRFLDKTLCKITYNLADHLIVHSEKLKNELTDIFGINWDKVFTIPHGICLDGATPITREKAKEILGINQERVLLFFGFVRKYKGLDNLLAALAKVAKNQDVALLVAGDFIDGIDYYKRLIDQLSLRDKVYIHPGYIDDEDTPLYFSAADVLVLPYLHFSGQTGIAPTAYVYSRPVIATNVGGLPEIVLHHKTGFVVEPENVDALADAIAYFLGSPEKIDKYGMNGKKFLEAELSWDAIAQSMYKIYSNQIKSAT